MQEGGRFRSPESPPPIAVARGPEPTRYSDYHADYLNHPTYRQYLLMHKICPGKKGSRQLEAFGDALSVETDPTLLSAAGSAYLEASITRGDDVDKSAKLELVDKAELIWERALRNDSILEVSGNASSEYTDGYRIAINLACLPMVRSMCEGNVTTDIIDQSIAKLLELGGLAALQKYLADKDGNTRAAAGYVGLGYEIDALVSLLYRRDPRFIALPSFQRSGTGYYYPEQTHDISLISQHYGTVRSIIPIEVKSRASRRYTQRYRALIVGGRAHLTLPHARNPGATIEAYGRERTGEATDQDMRTIDTVQLAVSGLLSSYKNSGKYKPLIRPKSRTTYYQGVSKRIVLKPKNKPELARAA